MDKRSRVGLRLLSSSKDAAWSRTPMFNVFALILLVAVAFSVGAGRPELLVLAIPFAVALAGGLREAMGNDAFMAYLEFERDSAIEGDTIDIIIELVSETGIARCEAELGLPVGLETIATRRAIFSVAPGVPSRLHLPVSVATWGKLSPEQLSIRVTDRWGTVSRGFTFSYPGELRVMLHDERLRRTVAPGRFREVVGTHLSTSRGEGIELADVREYRPGDPLKSLNWRISNRRQEPWVTVRHPDRSATVVLIADQFSTSVAGNDRHHARAIEALARTHLGLQDRVGLLVAGERVAWVEPQVGAQQMYRISEAMLDVSRHGSEQTSADLAKTVPLGAIVIVVSPLLDTRIQDVIAGLRARGRRVFILEPVLDVDDLVPDSSVPERSTEHGRLLFKIRRQVDRNDLTRRGWMVVPWPVDQPIEPAMRQMRRLSEMVGWVR